MLVALAYLTVVLIWTTTPLAIVWSGEIDWFFGVAARTLLGAVFILPFLWFLNAGKFRLDFAALKVYFFASLTILGGLTAMYWSGQYLPSGWIAILFALSPVVTGIFAYYLLPNQQLSRMQILAIFFSLSGLLFIFSPNLSTELVGYQIVAILVAILSVSFHSLGTVLVKRCGTTISALHVVIAALWITVLGHFAMSPSTLFEWPELTNRAAYAIVYAALAGSVVGFLLYFYLIRHVDAMKVSFIPVIKPVFALVIGHYLNGEPLG